jgi:hypothetical protein
MIARAGFRASELDSTVYSRHDLSWGINLFRMNVEIINTSGRELPEELEDALIQYAAYHDFRETHNRVVIDTYSFKYDVRGIFIEVDQDHVVIWISDWYASLL